MKKHIAHNKRGHGKKEWRDCPSDWDKRMEEQKESKRGVGRDEKES